MKKDSKPRRTDDFEVIDMNDGTVIRQDNMVHTLNETGSEILDLCDGCRTVRSIIEEMENRYPQDDIESYVISFLEQIHTSGLVEMQ